MSACVRACASLYVRVCVCASVSAYVRVCECMRARASLYVCERARACLSVFCVCLCLFVCVLESMSTNRLKSQEVRAYRARMNHALRREAMGTSFPVSANCTSNSKGEVDTDSIHAPQRLNRQLKEIHSEKN